MRMIVLMLRCRHAPRKWALGHALYSMILGVCNVRQDHLGLALTANTYL